MLVILSTTLSVVTKLQSLEEASIPDNACKSEERRAVGWYNEAQGFGVWPFNLYQDCGRLVFNGRQRVTAFDWLDVAINSSYGERTRVFNYI